MVTDVLDDIVPPSPHDFIELRSPDTGLPVWVYPEPLHTADPDRMWLLQRFSDMPTQAALLGVAKNYIGVNARLGSLREEMMAAASSDAQLYRDCAQAVSHPTDYVIAMVGNKASLHRVTGVKVPACDLREREHHGPAYELQLADALASSKAQKDKMYAMCRRVLADAEGSTAAVLTRPTWHSWSLDMFEHPSRLVGRYDGFFDRSDARFFSGKGKRDKIRFSSVWAKWVPKTLTDGKPDGYLALWPDAPSHHERENGIVVWTDEDPKK